MNKIIAWDLMVKWSDNTSEYQYLYDIPDHIVRDLQDYFTFLEEKENED